MTIIYLIIIALFSSFLIVIIYLASRKIKWQDKYIEEILEEKSKMSDKLRLKGVEIDRLWKRIKKAEKDFNVRIVG